MQTCKNLGSRIFWEGNLGNFRKSVSVLSNLSKEQCLRKQETYLGDKIDISGGLKPTIKSRISKGYEAIINIIAITNEVPLAHLMPFLIIFSCDEQLKK